MYTLKCLIFVQLSNFMVDEISHFHVKYMFCLKDFTGLFGNPLWRAPKNPKLKNKIVNQVLIMKELSGVNFIKIGDTWWIGICLTLS